MLRWWLLALLLLPVANHVALASDQSEIRVIAVETGIWQPRMSVAGQVKAWREVTLSAPFSTLVESVSAEVGQRMTRGQPLAQLDIPALVVRLANLREAKNRADLARQHLTRVSRLLGENLATRSERVQAEDGLSRMKAEVSAAWLEMQDALLQLGHSVSRQTLLQQISQQPVETLARGFAQLRAPFTAIVTQREGTAGSWVVSGKPLFTLQDMSQMVVELQLPAEDVTTWLDSTAFLHPPDASRVMLHPLTQVPSIDRPTGLVTVRFQADNTGGQLLDGAWVPVDLEGKPRQVLWIPESAVVGRAGKTYCIRHHGEGMEPVEVHVGPTVNGRVPVLSGLEAGDQVVTQDAYLLLYRDLKALMRLPD